MIPVAARNVDTGRLIARRVEMADTYLKRTLGLMGRKGLGPDEALWIVPSRGVHTCWMRFPIDVAALDPEGRIVDMVFNLRPWRIRLPRPATAGVLELTAGSLQQAGARLGHRIVFEPPQPTRPENPG